MVICQTNERSMNGLVASTRRPEQGRYNNFDHGYHGGLYASPISFARGVTGEFLLTELARELARKGIFLHLKASWHQVASHGRDLDIPFGHWLGHIFFANTRAH